MSDEDTEVWLSLVGRGWPFWMPQNYLKADGRDADLMLEAQRYVQRQRPRDYILAFGPVFVAGALQRCDVLDPLEGFL